MNEWIYGWMNKFNQSTATPNRLPKNMNNIALDIMLSLFLFCDVFVNVCELHALTYVGQSDTSSIFSRCAHLVADICHYILLESRLATCI